LKDWLINEKRIDAAQLLIRVDPDAGPAIIPKLMELLTTPGSSRTQVAAANVLATLGTKARAAVPTLSKAIASPDPNVRSAAGKALFAIDPQAASRAGLKENDGYVTPPSRHAPGG